MKISLLKISWKKVVINRLELKDLAEMIRKSPVEQKVFNVRLNYLFYQPQRQDDGQIVIDVLDHTVNLPRILFVAEWVNYKVGRGVARRASARSCCLRNCATITTTS